MPLDFNVAEMATRMRRALGVRGRIPLTADETTVGVYQLADLEKSPWRQAGRSYRCFVNTAPTAGQYGTVAITNSGTRPFVIEELGIFAGGICIVQTGFGQVGLAGSSPLPAITGELMSGAIDGVEPPSQVFTERNSGLTIIRYDTAVATNIGQVQADTNFSMANGEKIIFSNLDVTVQPPKGTAIPGYLISSLTVTVSMNVWARVRMYE
jgi:hypothetical protein